MRICKICGIGIGEHLKLPTSYGAGLYCKVCYKYRNRETSLIHYHTVYDKSKRCVEPEKKECKLCGKSFFTSYKQKVLCSEECQKEKKKIDNIERYEKCLKY